MVWKRNKEVSKMNYNFIVEGNHPIFMRVDRRCITIEEANNVKRGLDAVGYDVKIKPLPEKEN